MLAMNILLSEQILTSEYWRLQKLHELVDLDEHIDGHLELGTISG